MNWGLVVTCLTTCLSSYVMRVGSCGTLTMAAYGLVACNRHVTALLHTLYSSIKLLCPLADFYQARANLVQGKKSEHLLQPDDLA